MTEFRIRQDEIIEEYFDAWTSLNSDDRVAAPYLIKGNRKENGAPLHVLDRNGFLVASVDVINVEKVSMLTANWVSSPAVLKEMQEIVDRWKLLYLRENITIG